MWIEEKPERWQWVAFCKDGTILRQFDDESGLFHRVGEINQEKLHVFRVEKRENTQKFYDLYFKPDMRLIYKYDVGRQWIFEDEKKTKGYPFDYKNYVFGFKKSGQYVLNMILPDDNVVIVDNPQFVVSFGG